jgi:exoribonuclease-2
VVKASVKANDIVAVVLKGAPLIGRLQSLKGSKAVVSFGGQRRDQDLPLRELVAVGHVSDHSLPTPEEVSEWIPDRKTAAEAWWILAADADAFQQHQTLIELTDLLTAKVETPTIAATWSWLHGAQPWFRWRRDQSISVVPLDEIQRQRKLQKQERLAEEHTRRQIAVLTSSSPLSSEQLETLDSEWSDRLDRLVDRARDDASTLKDDPDVVLWAQVFSQSLDQASLRQWCIQRGLLDPHQPRALHSSVWSKTFAIELEQEAQRLISCAEEPQPGDDNRLDLCHLATYTLDDAGTREIDDGLSFDVQGDEAWIWVHIADPARLIPPGSPLDQEARRRGTSLYLADGVLPMLPLGLAAGPLSLRAGQRTAAVSVAVRLDSAGAIADRRITRSWVLPRYSLTYADGDELIELAPPGDEALADLSQLMQRRSRWRRQQGALMFDRMEGRFRRRDGELSLQVVEPSPARLMVSEAMLLMGAVVAEFGCRNQLALPFRSQPPAELPSQAELDQLPEGPARDAAIKRCLSRGVQGTQPMAHFSLGLAAYVQATSPIRRYADLASHRQIIAQLEESTPLSEPELGELIDDLDDPLRQSIQISREDQRHWQQVWFAQHRDERWNAEFLRWLRPQEGLALVHLAELAMDVVGRVDQANPNPGDRMTLTVKLADPDRGELQLQLV